MRLRIAKKILNTHDKNYLKRYRELRKPFKKVINGSERLGYPSWHDLPLVKKATRRIIRQHNKYKYKNNNDEV